MALPVLPVLAAMILIGLSFLAWLWFSASFLLWGARLAGIERRSFGSALGTTLLGGLASLVLAGVLGPATLAGPGLGLLLGFCVSALVMTAIFETTFGRALAANILAWVLSLVVTGGFILLAAFVLGAAFAFFTW